MSEPTLTNETAYYYPEPYWLANEDDWIKSLLLFFDDIAILLPDYMAGRQLVADPTLSGPLQERGLLKVLQPEWFVDEEAAGKLTDMMTALIESGAFDNLSKENEFAAISMSRMGFRSDPKLADKVFKSLEDRGLARRSRDGVSIPMQPIIRSAYLVMLAQLARQSGLKHDLDLHPVTNVPSAEHSFKSLFDLAPMPSRGQVISFDLEVVSVDLERVPLDEVLQFKQENRDAYRRYMHNLRAFVGSLSNLEPLDRQRALQDRQAELREEAQALQRLSMKAWRSPKNLTGFSLGLTGAAITLATASGVHPNPVPGAIISALATIIGMLPEAKEANAYTYLFKAASGLH